MWPAFWALGNDIETNSWPNCGEIDIIEYVGKNPGQIFTSVHTPSSFGNTITHKSLLLQMLKMIFMSILLSGIRILLNFSLMILAFTAMRLKVKIMKHGPLTSPSFLYSI